MKRVIATAVLIVGLIVLALPALAATSTVTLTADNIFKPGTISVAAGDTVSFVWDGGFHDVTFSDGQKSGAPVGDVGTKYNRTFSSAGTFAYVCSVHEALGMKGAITVGAATTTASSGSQSLPLTGPEDSLIPIAGALLALAGVVMFKRARSQE